MYLDPCLHKPRLHNRLPTKRSVVGSGVRLGAIVRRCWWATLRSCPPSLALLSVQRDIDQPLMRIGDVPTIGCASYSDSGGGPFPKGLLAVCRGVDLPLLTIAGADDSSAALGHCAGWTLGHRHFEISLLPARARKRPRHNDVTAVVGHDGDRVQWC